MRIEAVDNATSSGSRRPRRRVLASLAACAALCVMLAACSGGGSASASHGPTREANTGNPAGAGPADVKVSITPAGGRVDAAPQRGITVTASGGTITKVAVRTGGERVTGTLSAGGTVWRSRWALNVSQRYTVTATAAGSSGRQVTRSSSFRTLTPKNTVTARIIEGYQQTYGVGIPIVLYFSTPVTNRSAVERSLQVTTSKRVVGAWYWDTRCNMAPVCLYFRPRHYWPTHTRVSFVGHLNGVKVAPAVYGDHTLTQQFTIGSALTVVASTSGHYMNVYRDGRLFAHWPISSGRPGDDTPNGNYLTIEKANPVDMVGPGYNIEVPWSVRFTWSGDYLHDAYWSVGDQGFTNVSHGCVNMSPANAETYYNMAVPGDPVKVIGSPRPGVWDNGWTMWFLNWRQWLRGSALHKAVQTGPHGSTFVSAALPTRHRRQPRRGSRHA